MKEKSSKKESIKKDREKEEDASSLVSAEPQNALLGIVNAYGSRKVVETAVEKLARSDSVLFKPRITRIYRITSPRAGGKAVG